MSEERKLEIAVDVGRSRPRTMPQLQSLARSKTKSAIDVLFRIMLNEKVSASCRVAAANSILDRGWGRPVQMIEAGENGPIQIHRIERHIVQSALSACGVAEISQAGLPDLLNESLDEELPPL